MPFGEVDVPATIAPPVADLELADAPSVSRIGWLAERNVRVPIKVAASGPKAIAVAAPHADRIMFALGADVERIAWGMSEACEARRPRGWTPKGSRLAPI